MGQHINLVKLCVGVDSFEDLATHIAARGGKSRHVTRMWPKREAEILDGGSLFWVIKGVLQARQRIISLEEVIGADGIRRCGIVLDAKLVRTAPAPRRPFQGWRYLKPEDSPPDLTGAKRDETDLPAELQTALANIGVL